MSLDTHEDREPYPSCALPVGMKAQFWREYFRMNLHMQIERRSIIDCILWELELCEQQLVSVNAEKESICGDGNSPRGSSWGWWGLFRSRLFTRICSTPRARRSVRTWAGPIGAV